jgi:hypothetical protein
MRAAADAAEDDSAPIPPELSTAWNVERYGAVAVLGNKEIPVKLMRRMNIVSNVYIAFTSYNTGKHRLAEWARVHPTYAKIVQDIRELRRQDGR